MLAFTKVIKYNQGMYTGADNTEADANSRQNEYSLNHHEPTWKVKEQRRNFRKKIFGEHYNYNYRRPNQHKMYRIQENRNTEIERENRILLEKIQGIFKRSLGRKKMAMFDSEEQETHNYIRENIAHARSRRSTETITQKKAQGTEEANKPHSRPKRMQTELILQKQIKPTVQKTSRAHENEHSEAELHTKRRKTEITEIGHRVTLFKGTHCISKTEFNILIYVKGTVYSIIAEQADAEVQEQINIPYEDYKKLHKEYLGKDHTAILDYLHINVDSGLLELVGFEAGLMDIVQYGEASLGRKDKNNVLPELETSKRKQHEAMSPANRRSSPEAGVKKASPYRVSPSTSKKHSKQKQLECKKSPAVKGRNPEPRESLTNSKKSSQQNDNSSSMQPLIDDHSEIPEEI